MPIEPFYLYGRRQIGGPTHQMFFVFCEPTKLFLNVGAPTPSSLSLSLSVLVRCRAGQETKFTQICKQKSSIMIIGTKGKINDYWKFTGREPWWLVSQAPSSKDAYSYYGKCSRVVVVHYSDIVGFHRRVVCICHNAKLFPFRLWSLRIGRGKIWIFIIKPNPNLNY